MAYVTVITLAAAAGGAVAAITLYQGRPRPTEAAGRPSAGAAQASPQPPAGRAQARALPSTPTAQTRMIGALGLVVAVLAGAGLIALLCFLVYAGVKHVVG